MDNRDLLLALASVAATFVGFASVVFAVGRASDAGLRIAERNALSHLSIPSICILLLAFLPILIDLGFTSQPPLWKAP